MNRGKKIIIGLIILIIALCLALVLYITNLAKSGLPQYSGQLQLKGLLQPVKVYRDEYGIPHIYAKNEKDLYLATGFIMAQDRMWQMDLLRRVTTGRLSEIFGDSMLETDVLMRALQITKKSKYVIAHTDPNVIAHLQAFADGVNQYIFHYNENLPLEFRILGYKPENWKVEDSVNLIGYMAWDLTMPWTTETILYKIWKKVDQVHAKALTPDVKYITDVIYQQYVRQEDLPELSDTILGATQKLIDIGAGIFFASNNWAVSGKKSVTGKPILANDMHLGLFIPGIWYQMHQVVDGKLNVTGVAIPGEPSIVCGHNEHIAWGMTNVMVDDMDFYLEKVNPANKLQYQFNGTWKNFTVVKEEIKIKGGQSVTKEILFTHRGPVITDFKKMNDVISMRWMGNEPSNELLTVYMLNRAKNWKDFTNAISHFRSVSQNIVYADVNGNIGLYCAAGIPIRKGNPMMINPGWTSEYDWKGIVPFERQPHVFNPSQGFVASANNKTVMEKYPFYISYWFEMPWRYNRIVTLLTQKEKLSVNDFKTIQTDQVSELAKTWKPLLLQIIEGDSSLMDQLKNIYTIIKEWDCSYSVDSIAATLFDTFYIKLAYNIFHDELGDELYQELMKERVLVNLFIDTIRINNGSIWCDDVTTTPKESFNDIVARSLKDAVLSCKNDFGNNPVKWKWGSAHKLVLKHPLGEVKILDWMFRYNRGPYPVGGSFHTVCPYSYKLTNPFVITDGASQRHIYPMHNLNESLTVIPTGISGHTASPYYCNQTQMYVEMKYHNDYIDSELIQRNAKFIMTLLP
ncbi:MAG: penicillin acylase family protein [Spirochaetes bacterium]|nr:penicillin acylase family protein [Spirochaetota bacterium]